MLACHLTNDVLTQSRGCRYAVVLLTPKNQDYPPLVSHFEPIIPQPDSPPPRFGYPDLLAAECRLRARTGRPTWDMIFGMFFGTEFLILP